MPASTVTVRSRGIELDHAVQPEVVATSKRGAPSEMLATAAAGDDGHAGAMAAPTAADGASGVSGRQTRRD